MQQAYSAQFTHHRYLTPDEEKVTQARLDKMVRTSDLALCHEIAQEIKLDVREIRRLWWEGADDAKDNDKATDSHDTASVTSSVEDEYTEVYNALRDRQRQLPAQDLANLLKKGPSITIERSPHQQLEWLKDLFHEAQDMVAAVYAQQNGHPNKPLHPGDERSPAGSLQSADGR